MRAKEPGDAATFQFLRQTFISFETLLIADKLIHIDSFDICVVFVLLNERLKRSAKDFLGLCSLTVYPAVSLINRARG